MIKIKINSSDEISYAAQIVAEKLGIELKDDGTVINAVKGDKLKISCLDNEYTIQYSIIPEFLRGLAICTDAIKKGKFQPVCQKRQFETCGVMPDLSSGMVFTVDTLKDVLEHMAIMGLNMLMLYIEDVYEMDGYPMFGYMRGRYTKDEIKTIDSHAKKLGIELIPAIQTLSHLGATLHWNYASKFRNTNTTLYVGKDETYKFIEDMFRNIADCFTSRRINIGLDEAKDMTKGKFLEENGAVDGFELMIKHTNHVCDIASKYGFKPMMWSDMFYKFGHIGGDYDYTSKIPEGSDKKISPDVELIYWDYCHEDKRVTDHFIESHQKELKRETIFAGGIWNWYRLVPNYRKTIATANSQLKSSKEHNLNTVFVTMWGRYDIYAALPGFQIYAEHCYNEEVSNEQLSCMFKICTGYDLKDFLLMGFDDFSDELLDEYKSTPAFCVNSSVHHFFNDVLIGLYDKTLSGFDFRKHYKKYISSLDKLGDMGKFNPSFNEAKVLARILEIKSYAGIELAKAYKCDDKKELSRLTGVLKTLLNLYKEYRNIAREKWFSECKPFGWEVAEHRISGMIARTDTAIYRIEGYLNGVFSYISELEEERFYYRDCEKPLTETLTTDSISRVYIK